MVAQQRVAFFERASHVVAQQKRVRKRGTQCPLSKGSLEYCCAPTPKRTWFISIKKGAAGCVICTNAAPPLRACCPLRFLWRTRCAPLTRTLCFARAQRSKSAKSAKSAMVAQQRVARHPLFTPTACLNAPSLFEPLLPRCAPSEPFNLRNLRNI
jgi:hypothetical protein